MTGPVKGLTFSFCASAETGGAPELILYKFDQQPSTSYVSVATWTLGNGDWKRAVRNIVNLC